MKKTIPLCCNVSVAIIKAFCCCCFKEARSSYRKILTESARKLNAQGSQLGACIEKARPYYEARRLAKEVCERVFFFPLKTCTVILPDAETHVLEYSSPRRSGKENVLRLTSVKKVIQRISLGLMIITGQDSPCVP